MGQNKLDILQRALIREKAARKQAEKILEEKSLELYNANQQLEKLNLDLETLLTRTDSQLQGVFENIIDAYVIMDLNGNILKMNNAALDLLGFQNDKVEYNLIRMVSKKDYEKMAVSFKNLMKKGSLKDFEINILTNKNKQLTVHINASIIYDKGIPVAAQGIIRDITSSKESELISEVINDITQSILGTMDIYEIASKITNKLAIYLKTNDCVIYSVNHLKNQVEQIAASGEKVNATGEIVNRLRFDIGKGIVGTVAKTGKSELILDTRKDTRYITDIAVNLSELTVPILIENEVIAVIDSEHPNKNHFNKIQLKTIENIASIIAIKIKNAINLKERELSQKKLFESEKRLRILISNLESGILLEDQNRKIVLTNSKFCEIFSIPVLPENMIGADCTTAAEQSKRLFKNPNGFVKRINSILSKKETVLTDEIIMTNGRILERDYIPLYNDNVYTGHLWNYKDVTLQKKYRQSIEALANKYENIIANMNLGLLEVDMDEKIVMANQSFLKISGYEKDELMGKIASEVFTVNEQKQKVLTENAKRLKKISNSYEIEVKNKVGEKRHWLISGAPNTNIKGEIIGSIGIHLDITELKLLELQKETLLKDLKNRNDELKEYAHVVSHDLKSPLRSIHALVSWIKEDNESKLDKASLENIALIQSTVEKMERLIIDILNYSNIGQNIEPTSTDINALINEIKRIVYIPENITIKTVKPLPTIIGDKVKLHQLFQNVLSNAIRYNDKEKGIIELDYKKNKTNYQFSIKDNGMGIEEKYFEKIFEIFHSLNKTKDSTGIGLSIVKKVVELHGGKIWIESKVGEGTTFYFTLNKE